MSDAIPCHDAVRRLWDYLDGGVEEDERTQIEQHLTFCLRCCGELEFARELRGLLHERREAPIPTATLTRLESFIDDLGDSRPGTTDAARNDRDEEPRRDP